MNPSLSANLRADYEALKNDCDQANELAADFQRQLAGKSNEFAMLKQIFQKTRHDLESLQEGIVALRDERHQLAGDVMILTAELAKANREVANFRNELEFARQALTNTTEEYARRLKERDARIAQLTLQNVTLRQAAIEQRRREDDPTAAR